MAEPLVRSGIAEAGEFADLCEGLAAAGARVVEPLRVVSLRCLRDGADSLERALRELGIDGLPAPGRFSGSDPCVLWSSPSEWLLLTRPDQVAHDLLNALAPGRDALACAIDRTDAYAAFELCSPRVDEVLMRLVDASAIPRSPGCGTRARLADIAASLLRVDPGRAWLLVERSAGRYAAQWLAYALERSRD